MNHAHATRLGRAVIISIAAAAAILATGCSGSPKTTSSTAPVAPKGRYAFWPQFPEEPRVQFVRSIANSEDVSEKGQSDFDKLVFGKQARDSEALNKPYGVAMHDGKLYVCDIRAECLTVLDIKKKQTRLVGVNGMMALKRPVAVAVADDGMIYVADNDKGSIFVFDAQERYLRVMGHPKLKPAGVAVFGDRLYVTDLGSQSVEWYNRKTGEQGGSWGAVGDGDGEFRLPLGIAIDTKGDVFVADMMRCRIQKFTADGKFISGFGSVGDFSGAFVRPKHIAVDADGVIYVVDAAFQNVQMFDSEFHLLMHFGSDGSFPGAMNLPAGICVSSQGIDLLADRISPGFKATRLVIVTNQFGNMPVSIYAVGGLREGYSAADLAASALAIPSGVGEGAKNILQSPTPGSDAVPVPGEGPRPGTPAPAGDAPAKSPAQPAPAAAPAAPPPSSPAPAKPK